MKQILAILATTALFLLPTIARAQTYQPSNRIPVADNSQIGTQRSPGTNNNFDITGGFQRGQHLFHSFTDFSVPTGGSANFIKPTGTQSIITRVTGDNFSDINGLVNTNGANFLLINPNGVVFGTNAKLNVGRAFVTSTASGVDFVDGAGKNYNFGVNQAGDALLKIDPNVAFNPARLIIGGSGSKGIENYGNISRSPGDYTGFIGGDVTFNGGNIYAGGSKIELGGLRQSGSIEFSLQNGVKFPKDVERSNVSLLSNGNISSEIYVRSGEGGSVNIFAKDINIKGNDTGIKAGIGNGEGSATAIAGDIKIDATGNIDLTDGAVIYNKVGSGGLGTGGEIEIATRNLSAKNSAQIFTNTEASGNGGNIKINATGDILFDGGIDGNRSGVLNKVAIGAVGNAGKIEIITRNLDIKNGAQLFASTYSKGDAGNIKINATGDIFFDGGVSNHRSGILSRVEKEGVGKAGDIEIITRNLDIKNGAGVTATTEGNGHGGNIKINATGNILIDGRKDGFNSTLFNVVNNTAVGNGGGIDIAAKNLFVTNGAGLTSSTYGTGDAGNIKINVADNVSFDGGIDKVHNGAFSRVEDRGEGKAGNIEIATRNLSVKNGAVITTSMEGTGSAGDILLKSNTIKLNQGEISSKSLSSAGGNINLVVTDLFLMQNNSLIATDSDSTGKNGNGGNIVISSPLIVATPGNNDITANAYKGKGGRVNITAQGLFGIQSRPQGSLFTNDITASSQEGPSGDVQINTPGTDPGKNKGELAEAPNDASKQISQACGASQRVNKFYITGRGGLPPNAREALESEALWEDARAVKTKPALTAIQPQQFTAPAVGWMFEPNGRVRLIAAQTGAGATGTRAVCPK